MAVYTFFKSILDVPSFVAYIAKTLSSVSSASSVDGQSISVVFTAALSSAQQKTLTTLVQVYLDPTLAAYSTLNLLTYNRSSTALAASAVYTGLWEDVSQYQTVIVFVLASCSSTDAGLQVQFGYSKQQSDLISSFTVLNDSPLTLTLANPGRYVRIVYSNGAVAQDNFALQVRTSVARISNSDASSGNSERTASSDSALSSSLQSVALVQSSFVYSINPETVNTLVTGGGSVSQASGVAIVNANGTDSAAYLVTRRYVLASVGTVVRALAAVTFNAGTAGCTQLAGVGNENDGLFVGFQDLQFGVMSRRSAVDTWTFSSAFNVDKLDGTGPSSTALVPTNGNVYQIVYDSTGFGGVSFALCSIAGNVLPEAVVMHRVSFSGPTAASMRLHSMPLMASVQNTSNSGSAALRVASLCAYGSGKSTSAGRLHSVDATKTLAPVVVAFTPLVTITSVATYQGIANTVALLLRGLSMSTTGGDGNVVFAVYEGAMLLDANFQPVSSQTSVAEYDRSATSLIGGTLLYTQSLASMSNECADLTQHDIQVGAGMKITVACKLASSAHSAVVTACLTWREDS